MPINVFGNSNSNNSGNKIDTSLFVKKPYLRTNFREAKIEEDNNMKNQFKFKNFSNPISIRDAASRSYVDNKLNDPSIMKKTLLMLILKIKILITFVLSKELNAHP